MRTPSRAHELRELEWELKNEAYRALLKKLRAKEEFYRRFQSWAEVVAFMRAGSSDDPEKDRVLEPILREHGEDGDPRWRQVLTVIFWPGLESICWQKQGLADDPDDLWQDIHCTFLEVLGRIDLKKRSRRLVQKIFNDTASYLSREYRRRERWMGREDPTDEIELEELAGPVEGIDFAGIDWREWREGEVRKLQPYVDQGVISEADLQLLMATRIDGLSTADYGRRNGLKPDTARKRRLRAEEAIREAGGDVPRAAEGLEHIGTAVRG